MAAHTELPDYICSEHSGVQVNIDNLNMKLCAQSTKIDQIFARINIILGSACISLVLVIIDIILRFEKLK